MLNTCSANRDALKWLAWGAMFVDHVGVVFDPSNPLWRVVGRLAYPLFLVLLVDGIRRTRSQDLFAFRIFLWAIVGEVAHWWAFGTGGNVLIGLAFAVLVAGREWWMALGAALALEFSGVEYGAASVAVTWLAASSSWRSFAWWVGGVMLAIKGWGEVLGWTAAVMPWCALVRPVAGSGRMPRWLSYGFYPGHLAALAILRGVWG